jgi:hypothetical protein
MVLPITRIFAEHSRLTKPLLNPARANRLLTEAMVTPDKPQIRNVLAIPAGKTGEQSHQHRC